LFLEKLLWRSCCGEVVPGEVVPGEVGNINKINVSRTTHHIEELI